MISRPASSRARLPLAIIGTGGMAHYHAKAYAKIPGCQIVAAMDIDPARVAAFCTQHAIPAAYTELDELLEKSPEVQAVSIVVPDAFHHSVSLRCLRAGKHVMCEKPLAVNYGEARAMRAAARRARKVAMVHLTYRSWPSLHAVAGLVHRGAIGEVRHVEASYLQSWLPSKIFGDWRASTKWLWRLSSAHGSKGVLGDLGVHLLDFATYPAGPIKSVHCRLKTFPKAPGNRFGAYRLDANDSAVIDAEFANGALGVLHTTRWASGHANRLYLKISGTKGAVEIDSDRATDAFRVCRGADLDQAVWREVKAKPVPPVLQCFVDSIRRGRPPSPDFARGAEMQQLLDACFASDAARRPVAI